MSRPEFPRCVLPSQCISRIREEQQAYDNNPKEYDRHEKEWSFNECVNRGCLPTGEPIEAKFGIGWWSK